MPLRTALVVDPDPGHQPLARRVLERIGGLVVIMVDSLAQALTLASATRPDVLVIDAALPDLDVGAVLAQLRADPRTAAIPVVFVTSRAAWRGVDDLISSGAAGVAPRPRDPRRGAVVDRPPAPPRLATGSVGLRQIKAALIAAEVAPAPIPEVLGDDPPTARIRLRRDGAGPAAVDGGMPARR